MRLHAVTFRADVPHWREPFFSVWHSWARPWGGPGRYLAFNRLVAWTRR